MKTKTEYIEEDYITTTIDDDDQMVEIKNSISGLKPQERQIFLDYVNKGSYAAVARRYNVSAPTARTYIERIMRLIKQQ